VDDDGGMTDEANREHFALRRAEQRMTAVEHELEADLDAFKAHLTDAEKTIEAEVREQHRGHPPERPLSWRAGG
jgi:hypothetical protein